LAVKLCRVELVSGQFGSGKLGFGSYGGFSLV